MNEPKPIDTEQLECRYRRCLCPADSAVGEEAYCSTYCRDADNSEEDPGVCYCGHATCGIGEEDIA